MKLVPHEVGYPIEPFECGLPAVLMWCFLLFHDWRYVDFQTGHFADFEQFKIDNHFANFRQDKTDPTCLFSLTLGWSVILMSLGKTLGCK